MQSNAGFSRLLLAVLVGFMAGIAGLVCSGAAMAQLGLFEHALLPLPILMVGFFAPVVLAVRWALKRHASAPSNSASTLVTESTSPTPAFSPATTPAPAALIPDTAPNAVDEIGAALAIAKAPAPAPKYSPMLLVILSLAGFILAGRGDQTIEQLVVLVTVLFFHEAGHIAGMRWFGYSDLRMLFVPFFGALASGRKASAPGWQQAVVLLLGPLPGLVLSLVLLVATPHGLGRTFAVQSMVINGLNLLPLVPLDGGRFVQQLFARFPRFQALFSAVSLLAFGGLALVGKSWLLVGIAVFSLLMVPAQLRIAKEAAQLRKEWTTVPPLTNLSDEAGRDLYRRARQIPQMPFPQPPLMGSLMRQVHERAATEPVSLPATVCLLAVYASGFFIIVVNTVLLVARRG